MEDYKIVVDNFKCNICDKMKLCLQCNECFVTTCVGCINIIKCNNCNNLFTKYELELIGFKKYKDKMNIVDREIKKHLEMYEIDIYKYTDWTKSIKNDILDNLKKCVIELTREIFNNLNVNCDKHLIKLFRQVRSMELVIITLDDYLWYTIEEFEKFPLIDIINQLIYTYVVYNYCSNFDNIRYIYCEFDKDKLADDIKHTIKSRTYRTKNYFDIKSMIDLYRKCYYKCGGYNKKHNECGNICKYYLKYYDDIKDKIICNKCNHYNFRYMEYTQIYCTNCSNIYDIISGKTESFIINPIIVYNYNNSNYCKHIITIINEYKFERYLGTLRKDVADKIAECGKYEIDSELNLYKVFYS